jgi:hypothetical protein
MNTAQNGKGDAPRPVDGERFRSGWDAIFGGKNHESVDEVAGRGKTECSKSNDHAVPTRSDLNT